MNGSKQIIYGFDLLKFIMALLIVSIHTRAFNDTMYAEYARIIQTWCVPTFFFLSSYFFMRKIVIQNNDRTQAYCRFIKRLGILYGLWFLINLPIYISRHDLIGIPIYKVLTDFAKGLIFASTFEGSWFLSALGVSVSLLFLLVYLRLNKWLILVIFTGMYVCMYAAGQGILHLNLYDWYCSHVYQIPTLSFPRALPFIALGYVMATPHITAIVTKVSLLKIRHLIPICLAIFLLVGVWINDLFIEQFIILIAVPLIVIYFYGLKLPDSNIWKTLRDCSILLYLLHFMIIVYLRHIPYLCDITGITKYLAVLIIAGSISYILLRMSRMPKVKVIQYLF